MEDGRLVAEQEVFGGQAGAADEPGAEEQEHATDQNHLSFPFV